MAKKKSAGGVSISAYFKEIFVERPDLLDTRSNEELYARWLGDNPGHKEVPLNIKQGLSNIKSTLRNKPKKRGRPSKRLAASNGVVTKTAHVSAAVLEKLEFNIDECLMLARSAHSEALADV